MQIADGNWNCIILFLSDKYTSSFNVRNRTTFLRATDEQWEPCLLDRYITLLMAGDTR